MSLLRQLDTALSCRDAIASKKDIFMNYLKKKGNNVVVVKTFVEIFEKSASCQVKVKHRTHAEINKKVRYVVYFLKHLIF